MNLTQQGGTQGQINQLNNAAASAGSLARASAAPLMSGVLPPGAQNALTTARQNMRAGTESAYARMGMAGSTGEADALDAINQNIAAQQFSMEDQMFGQAAGFAQVQGTDLNSAITAQQAQDTAFSNALSNFVKSITGSTGGQQTAL
jgi:hypothetical protein